MKQRLVTTSIKERENQIEAEALRVIELYGQEVIKPAMSSTSMVEAFDILKDGNFSLYMTFKRLSNVEEFTLKSSE